MQGLILGLSIFMVSAPAGMAAVPLFVLHGLRRRQAQMPTMIQVTADGHFALPDENRSGLTLTAASRSGPGWLQLSFADRPGQRLLLLSDQVDAGSWRVLRIAIRERR